jgi:hypothetical protein
MGYCGPKSMPKTTRDMSDRHEAYLQKLFGGKIQRGSGNQFNGQMDVRQPRDQGYYAFALDGKSTKAASITITREMWDKAVEQAHAHEPGLPLRFYDNGRLTEALDLIALDLHTFGRILADANAYHRVQGCIRGEHEMARDFSIKGSHFECQNCGQAEYEIAEASDRSYAAVIKAYVE